MDKDSKVVDIVIVLIEDAPRSDEGITCSTLKSRAPSRAYDAGWERTFGNKASNPQDMN